ncbi:MAG: hypothetical protein GY722_10225, partial [bacterium]|nr:hypothetical protein [bacterium]
MSVRVQTVEDTAVAGGDFSGWHRLSDLKLAPAGTRFIRVRLITARWGGDNADGYFDGLAVR